ncbi:hypothetical protein Tco_1514730 [Tanacetum coccineum]
MFPRHTSWSVPDKLSWNSIATFHVIESQEMYWAMKTLVIPLERDSKLRTKVHFIEEPVEIMDREVKELKQIQIPIVNV